MIRNNDNNRRNNVGAEKRMSAESVLTFASLQKESIFDGNELVDVFQNNNSSSSSSSNMNMNMNMNNTNEALMSSTSSLQYLSDKRGSSNTFDVPKESIYDGEELVDVFQPMNDTPMKCESFKDNTIITKQPPNEEEQDEIQQKEALALASSLYTSYCSPLKGMDNSNNSNNSNNSGETEQDERIEYIEQTRPYDIICGRNSGAHNCVGNRRFRVTIMMHLKRYMDAPSREDKTHVIKSVIELLLDTEEVGARFIKRVGDGMYITLQDKQIREKVGHAFRDMISLSEKETKKREAAANNPQQHFRSNRSCR